MPASTDVVIYHSANNPDADTGTQGGAIDTLRRPDFTQIAADDDIEQVSSSAADTMNGTLTTRANSGAIVSETRALTGTTAVIFSTTGVIDRVLQYELASAPAGTITARRSVAGATVRVVPIGERGFSAFIRKGASDPVATKNIYGKLHIKNTHATEACVNAKVRQNADPSGKVTHLLAAAKGDSATSSNRVTAPAAADTQDPDTFDDTDKSVPGTDLAAGESIAVWLRLALAAGDAPLNTTYTPDLLFESIS